MSVRGYRASGSNETELGPSDEATGGFGCPGPNERGHSAGYEQMSPGSLAYTWGVTGSTLFADSPLYFSDNRNASPSGGSKEPDCLTTMPQRLRL